MSKGSLFTETSIYCCGCEEEVQAKLVTGEDIYPHRIDLYHLPFWECPTCKNYVGTHNKTSNKTKPLGVIPTKELRNARNHIHGLLDPIWKFKRVKRKVVYSYLTEKLGKKYHTADIRTIQEAREVYRLLLHFKIIHNIT